MSIKAENTHMIAISGNTYPLKEKLKKMGFSWDPLSKKWINEKISDELIRTVLEKFEDNYDVTVHFFTNEEMSCFYKNIKIHGLI